MFFLYFYFVILLCPVTTSPAPQTSSIPTNASEYILRNVFDTADQCYKDSFVYVKASDDEISSPFSTYVTTKECSERLNKEDLPDNLPTCSPGLIDLDVRQVYVPKSQISYPYANLNISVTAHSSVDTIAFRLECLSASDGSDVYCSDSKSMYINNKKEWPCRGIHLSTRVIYPARFSYACFRLTSHSVYAINATVLPQKCRVTTIVTAPSFDDMFPEILVDPSVNKKTVASADPFWAPLIAADFSDENAIWLRLAKAHRAECETINVNVYKEHVNDSQKVSFLETLSIKCPENSIKWENQVAGKYLLTAYVPIRGCKFFCEKKERGCRQCLRTHLNLVVHETRVSLAWRASQTLNDYGFEIFVSCMCIVGLTCLAVLIITLYLCWKRKKESERVREIPLTEYVKAMIVYADDNELHTDCVKILVDNLRNCANCDPIFDLEKLITPEQIVPSRWLVDQLGSLSKFIIVISDCAEKILDTDASETHQLVQSRPFADLFGPAIEIIIRDATRNSAEARQKYAIVRFSYSPQVPANLTILNLPTFTLPEQFGHLTAFLHDLKDVERMNITQNISEGRIHEWNVAAGKQMLFFSQNPDWLNARWKPKDELAVMNLKRESPVVLPIETVEDRIAASKRFHLEPPRDDSDDEETHASNDENTFMLLPPGQNDSDSESDVEDEDDDEGSKTIVAHSS